MHHPSQQTRHRDAIVEQSRDADCQHPGFLTARSATPCSHHSFSPHNGASHRLQHGLHHFWHIRHLTFCLIIVDDGTRPFATRVIVRHHRHVSKPLQQLRPSAIASCLPRSPPQPKTRLMFSAPAQCRRRLWQGFSSASGVCAASTTTVGLLRCSEHFHTSANRLQTRRFSANQPADSRVPKKVSPALKQQVADVECALLCLSLLPSIAPTRAKAEWSHRCRDSSRRSLLQPASVTVRIDMTFH